MEVNKAACIRAFRQPRKNRFRNHNTYKNEQGIHARIPSFEHIFIVLVCKPNIGRPY